MVQAEQHLATTVTFTFSTDGEPADPDSRSATITITRADGTVLHTDAATTPGEVGSGEFSYKLVPAPDAASLDVLDLAWTATLDGVVQTFHTKVEIVGGFYFTIAEFKAKYADDEDVQALAPNAIAEARQVAEEIIEHTCNVAFVPRAKRFAALSGDGGTRLSIPLYRIRALRSGAIGGAAIDVSGVKLEASSLYRSIWTRGFGNVALTVEHGYDEPPRDVKDAAILLAYHRAIKGPIDDRATGIAAEGGVITFATPGRGGSITGIPEVDRVLKPVDEGGYALPSIKPVSISLGDRGRDYPPLPAL